MRNNLFSNARVLLTRAVVSELISRGFVPFLIRYRDIFSLYHTYIITILLGTGKGVDGTLL